MLDIKFIRDNPDLVRENMKKRFMDDELNLVDDVLNGDEEYRKLLQEVEQLRHQRNEVTGKINETKKTGGDITELLNQAKDIPKTIKEKEEKVSSLKDNILAAMRKIPNLIHESVPVGKDDSENVEIKKWGEPRQFGFPVKNHVEIIEKLGLADFEASAKTSGNGFYFLKGDLALMNQALIRFTIDHMIQKGYDYVEPPLMLHEPILSAAMDMEGFSQSIYRTDEDDLCLIGTSEYALLGMHSNEVIAENDLPKKYFAYSMCFRKEIGAHGINEKGLWRTHQFNKIEQFVFCRPEDSYRYFDDMLKISEEIYQALGIPYRILESCSGDLTVWKAKALDIEAWRPTIKGYGEICSLSNCTDYQARNLNIRVVRNDGNREVLHTLNNTAVATSRTMVAIIENYQNDDGSVTVPEVLRPYMNNKEKIFNV
ncbi:serine--tRNA ligase [Candidatus Woesearchaeota archaeon]|nr:serine--tRNA ligase [Candidatus Woesearchaeota archaeon]